MKRAQAVVLTGVLILACGLVYLNRGQAPKTQKPINTPDPAASRVRSTRPDPAVERDLRDATTERTIENDWRELVAWLESEPKPSASEIRERLVALRLAWTEKDFQVLATTLTRLLESGVDRDLGLAFRVGPHGFLQSWPTLRVFLLDVLAASDPEMAATTARAVLAKTDSADEFSVALRSLTRKGLARAADEELLAHFQTLLAHTEWKNSGGFGEAFDLARLLGSPEAATTLARWNENPKLRNRALDEFAAEHPSAAIAMLQSESPLEANARATLMARANPADPAQLAAVDAYLRDPVRQSDEVTVFLKAFPLRSATTGYRLYGKPPAPYTFDSITAGDRAALEQVTHWADDPQLESHRADLLELKERLADWVNQAQAR